MHGNIAANEMTQQSDLILAVGMRFSDRVTGDVKNYAPHAKIIHIDIDSAELGKNLPVELPIHADAGEALEAMKLGSSVGQRTARRGSTWPKAATGAKTTKLVRPSSDPQGRFISMYDAISTLAEVEKGDAVIVTDVGQNQMFSARYSKFNSTRSFITSGGLGTMGFGLPAALGAKLGVPDREVVCVMGDGGFQMTMQELGTIMQNRIGVKMIVLNNSYLGMVRQWQQLFFGKPPPVHAYRKPRPDADRRGLRHPEPPGHRARTAQGGHRGTGRRAGSLPARGGRAPRGKRIPDGTGRRLAVGHHLHGLKNDPDHHQGIYRHRLHRKPDRSAQPHHGPLSEAENQHRKPESVRIFDPGISMFVISAFTTRETIDKLVKQLRNIIDVIQVEYYSNEELITQEIALYKITSKIFRESGTVDRIVREWNARIIEMNPQYVVVEKTGTREDIDAMRSELEQQQLLTEFTRSGTVVLHRDSVEDKLQANL